MLKPRFVADNRGRARPSSPPRTRALRRRRRLRRRRPRPLQRRRRLRRRRGARHVPQAPAAQLRRVRRGPLLHAGQRDRPARALRRSAASRSASAICEDIWSPDGPLADAGRRRRRADHQHQRLAVPPRQGRRTASGCSPPAPPTRTPRSCTSTRSAARTSWSSTAARSSFDAEGTLLARGPQFVEDLLVVDVPDRRRSTASACSTRAAASSQAPLPHDRASSSAAGRATRRGRRRPDRRRAARPDRRAVPGARARHPRLLRARTASPTS